MPPYGIDSLLNRDFDTQGYFTSPVEEIYDPAFGTLNFNRAYGPAPFTGNIPLTSYRVEPGLQYLSDDGTLRNLGFEGDIELPSFGGVSGYRDTGGIMNIEPAVKSVDKVQGFVEDDDIEASAIPEFKEGELKQPGGIANFLRAILGFAIPGANLFMGDRSALQGIRSLNQRLRNTDFGRSKTLQEYFQKKEAKREAKRLAPIEKQLREASERGGGYQPTTQKQNVSRTASRRTDKGVGQGGVYGL